jgi:hypothetical protein
MTPATARRVARRRWDSTRLPVWTARCGCSEDLRAERRERSARVRAEQASWALQRWYLARPWTARGCGDGPR